MDSFMERKGVGWSHRDPKYRARQRRVLEILGGAEARRGLSGGATQHGHSRRCQAGRPGAILTIIIAQMFLFCQAKCVARQGEYKVRQPEDCHVPHPVDPAVRGRLSLSTMWRGDTG